jgi:outer membrane protein assembly factor BamD (BamD/ComL family)
VTKLVPVLLASLLAVTGCQAPPVGGEPVAPAPPPRVPSADAALGDSAGSTWSDTRARPPEKKMPADPTTASGLAHAKALADAGEHADAAAAYEEIYRFAPRSKLAEDALYFAAEEAFQAGQHYHALELFDRLLVLYSSTPHFPDVLERQFQIGKLYVEEKAKKPSWFIGVDKADAPYGIETLERFVKQRDQHALAPEALFLVGEAHLKADEPELAIESWQRLVRDYPRSTWARLGEYRIALAFVSLSYGVEYDKRPLMTGLKRLRNYINKYQTGDNIQEASLKRRELAEQLAQHELAIAKKYARRGKYRAAHIYLIGIQRDFPEAKTTKEEAKRLAAEWEDPIDPPAPDEPK